jgi:hypothetical protein
VCGVVHICDVADTVSSNLTFKLQPYKPAVVVVDSAVVASVVVVVVVGDGCVGSTEKIPFFCIYASNYAQ